MPPSMHLPRSWAYRQPSGTHSQDNALFGLDIYQDQKKKCALLSKHKIMRIHVYMQLFHTLCPRA
jgi:hypothetical protein